MPIYSRAFSRSEADAGGQRTGIRQKSATQAGGVGKFSRLWIDEAMFHGEHGVLIVSGISYLLLVGWMVPLTGLGSAKPAVTNLISL